MKTFTLFVFAFLFFECNTVFSQAGSLDSTFNKDGKIKSTSLNGSAVGLQANGKILVLGTGNNFSVVRLKSNGNIDKAFGNYGVASTSFEGYNVPSLLAVQADGKIIVAGYSIDNNNIYYTSLVRFNVNGKLDSSFGTNGQVKTDVNYYTPTGIAITSNGQIIISTTNNFNFVGDILILVYDTNGSLLNQVGYDSGPFTRDVSNAIAIQSNKNLIVTGSINANDPQNGGFALMRFMPNGMSDKNFGTDSGKTILNYGEGKALSILLNQKIVVVAGDSILARFTKNGFVDSAFGTNGKTKTVFQGNTIAIQADGKIIIAGSADSNFAVARYNRNGNIDNSFGKKGVAIINFNGYDNALSIAIQADKKIVVAGESVASDFSNSGVIARFENESTSADFISKENISVEQTPAIKIYPNPVQSVLNIEFNKTNHLNTTINIFDVSGKLLFSKSANGNAQINVEHLTAGAYFIKINNGDGKLLYNDKIIKQ